MNMDTNCYHEEEDDDYIDMELGSSNSFFCFSTATSSSPQATEFEFQISSFTFDQQTSKSTTFPADELFYKGKLLPLHLPPRLQMVQKLHHHHTTASATSVATTNFQEVKQQDHPIKSGNVSQSKSCRISSELIPDDCFYEWSTELSNHFIDNDQPKKSWSKKQLKLIKKSPLGQKLKASRVFLKSLFLKSGCSDESSNKAGTIVGEAGHVSKVGNDNLSKCRKISKKIPDGHFGNGAAFSTPSDVINMNKNLDKEGVEDDDSSNHRRSSSEKIKQQDPTKCLSSSSSLSSCSSSSSFAFSTNGVYELQICSANSEIDGSIEAAIAHCKKSQHPLRNKLK